MDYEVQRCTRRCATTGREFAEGETFYSVLRAEGAEVNRYDYSADAWEGPPEEGLIGWWKSTMPTRESKRARLAPNEVLLHFFHEIRQRPDEQDTLFVLALLLIRRRVMRLEESDRAEEGEGGESMALYCPRDETTYQVHSAHLSEQRIDEIQNRLAGLLFADAQPGDQPS